MGIDSKCPFHKLIGAIKEILAVYNPRIIDQNIDPSMNIN
jgi:hypothetical protein